MSLLPSSLPPRFALLPLLLLFTLPLPLLRAGDLMQLSPITDKILLVQVRDGHIDYKPGFENSGSNVIYHRPSDTSALQNLSSYSISSLDDPNYASAKAPIYIGRKSKSIEWHDYYSSPQNILGHWIYLELPDALVAGKTYTITFSAGLFDNFRQFSLIFDVNRVRSETIHVNMIGFVPTGPKRAYLSHWMGSFNNGLHQAGGLNLNNKAGKAFRLINVVTGQTAFSGSLPASARHPKTATDHFNVNGFGPEFNYTHADVWELNFDSFSTPGEYILAVDEIGSSFPFRIGDDVGRAPFYYAMKGLFWQRLGIVKLVEGNKVMPRDHHPNDIIWRYDSGTVTTSHPGSYNASAPRVFQNANFAGGHYHDAGDWDHYDSHMMIPASLMLLYDLAPSRFFDGEVGNKYKLAASDANWIDEGTNGLPDLLDEASWLIKFMKFVRNRLMTERGTTGGVPGWIGQDACVGDNSWSDPRDWIVTGENATATYHYSGLAAWFASILGSSHPDYAMWSSEATAAWNWANAASPNSTDPRAFAAACMFRLTGTASYQTTFKSIYNAEPDDAGGRGDWSGANSLSHAMALYGMLPSSHPNLDAPFQATVKNKIKSNADGMLPQGTTRTGFRTSHTHPYVPFGIGLLNTPGNLNYAVQHTISGSKAYFDNVHYMTSYTLGGNELNTVYVSGLGERSDECLFHPDSWTVNDHNSRVYYNECLPGLTSYFGAYSDFFAGPSTFNEWCSRTVGSHPPITGNSSATPNNWPESEERFFNRNSIAGSEFTVHQQNRQMIFNYGYIKAASYTGTDPYIPNARPTVSINLTDGQNLSQDGFILTATASPDTRLVKYYSDWHFIGESFDAANGFPVSYAPLTSGSGILYTAVAFDDTGLISSPSDAGDRSVNITPGSGTAAAGGATGGGLTSGGIGGATTSGGVGGATTSGGVGGATTSGGVGGATTSGGVGGATTSGGVGGANTSGGVGGATTSGGVGGATTSGGASTSGGATASGGGSADWDGDGNPDLLIQRGTSLSLIPLSNFLPVDPVAPVLASPPLARGYKVFAVADFDGDGVKDIVSRRGAQLTVFNGLDGSLFTTTKASSRLKVAATGRFVDRGTAEILLQQGRSLSAMPFLDGVLQPTELLSTSVPAGYRAAGAGDFGGDASRSDVILQRGSELRVLKSQSGEWVDEALDVVTGTVGAVADFDRNGQWEWISRKGPNYYGPAGSFQSAARGRLVGPK